MSPLTNSYVVMFEPSDTVRVSVGESAVNAIGAGVKAVILGTVILDVIVRTRLPIVSVATTLMLLVAGFPET